MITNSFEYDNLTLTKFIFSQEDQHWQSTGEFTKLLNALQTIAKTITAILRKGGLLDPVGLMSGKSDVKTIKTLANETFVRILSQTKSVGIMISADDRNVIEVEVGKRGKYIVAFSPLDGIRNLDVHITNGSSFVILERPDKTIPCKDDALNPQIKIISSGYFIYSTTTLFVYTTGTEVNEFMLNTEIGEFFLTQQNIKIRNKSHFYSANEGYFKLWQDGLQNYLMDQKTDDQTNNFSCRYVGSLTVDCHRTLKHGGVFMNPGTKLEPNGQLKLLCECYSLAFIFIIAGGLATNGRVSITDLKPKSLHEKTPLFLGSKDDIVEIIRYLRH